MLRYLCSYEQISPILIDVLTSFGRQKAPLGFHSASFCQDDLTKPSQPALVEIPEFGRSGWELRHCYKLHGLELSSPNSKAKWAMRQTAIYHSFDMENGRAMWLTIKANNEIRDRIKEGTECLEAMQASNSSSPASSFLACLTTHLIAFDWCTEGWRLHLGDIESDVREILVKVKSTPLEPLGDELNFTPRLISAATMPSLRDRESSMVSQQSTLKARNSPLQDFGAAKAGITNIRTAMNPIVPEAKVEKSGETNPPRDAQADQRERISNHLEKLKDFSFAEFQKLNFVTGKLQEAKLAMNLNIGVMRSARVYYRQRYQSAQFPSAIKDSSEADGTFEHFVQHVTSLERDLEADVARTEALILLIEDGKRLVSSSSPPPPQKKTCSFFPVQTAERHPTQYDTILQSYKMEINKLFTLSGHGISERMEKVTDSMHDIARATARDSASMSVITFVTLILLPGTFLGVRLVTSSMRSTPGSLTSNQTFFSTPIIDTPQDNAQSWEINRGAFLLFIEICVPMTILVMSIWTVYMAISRRRRLGPWKGDSCGEGSC